MRPNALCARHNRPIPPLTIIQAKHKAEPPRVATLAEYAMRYTPTFRGCKTDKIRAWITNARAACIWPLSLQMGKGENDKMVDSTDAAYGQFITASLIDRSLTKRAVVLNEGAYEKTDYGNKLTLLVEIDGRQKLYRPNQESAQNISKEYGVDTKQWVGKLIGFTVTKMKGKDVPLAFVYPPSLAVPATR